MRCILGKPLRHCRQLGVQSLVPSQRGFASYTPLSARDKQFLKDSDLDLLISKTVLLNSSVALSSPSLSSEQRSDVTDNVCLAAQLTGGLGAVPSLRGRLLCTWAWHLLKRALAMDSSSPQRRSDLRSALTCVMNHWSNRQSANACRQLITEIRAAFSVHSWSDAMWHVCGSIALKTERRSDAIQLMNSLIVAHSPGGHPPAAGQCTAGFWLAALRVWSIRQAPHLVVANSVHIVSRLSAELLSDTCEWNRRRQLLAAMAHVLTSFLEATASGTHSSLNHAWLADERSPVFAQFKGCVTLFAQCCKHTNEQFLRQFCRDFREKYAQYLSHDSKVLDLLRNCADEICSENDSSANLRPVLECELVTLNRGALRRRSNAMNSDSGVLLADASSSACLWPSTVAVDSGCDVYSAIVCKLQMAANRSGDEHSSARRKSVCLREVVQMCLWRAPMCALALMSDASSLICAGIKFRIDDAICRKWFLCTLSSLSTLNLANTALSSAETNGLSESDFGQSTLLLEESTHQSDEEHELEIMHSSLQMTFMQRIGKIYKHFGGLLDTS